MWKVSKYVVFTGPNSGRIRENTDQKKFRIWTLFTQCFIITKKTKMLSYLMTTNSGPFLKLAPFARKIKLTLPTTYQCFHLFRRSRSQMFFKAVALKHFAILTGKHLCWSLFFNKGAGLWSNILLKRDSNAGVFL